MTVVHVIGSNEEPPLLCFRGINGNVQSACSACPAGLTTGACPHLLSLSQECPDNTSTPTRPSPFARAEVCKPSPRFEPVCSQFHDQNQSNLVCRAGKKSCGWFRGCWLIFTRANLAYPGLWICCCCCSSKGCERREDERGCQRSVICGKPGLANCEALRCDQLEMPNISSCLRAS